MSQLLKFQLKNKDISRDSKREMLRHFIGIGGVVFTLPQLMVKEM